IEQKVGKIRKVLHFENEIEHKILVTYVIAKVSDYMPSETVLCASDGTAIRAADGMLSECLLRL
ncbi:hypothetical protein BHU43_10060, partial [Neisseria meningitidis]